MKLISWNIDSLNAALTSDSDRAKLSKNVLEKIAGLEPDIIALQETKLYEAGPNKKHTEALEKYFPGYTNVWISSVGPARKGYAGTMFIYKEDLSPEVTFPKIGAPDTMDSEGRMITLEFKDFFVTQVYTPNAGNELNRLSDRQIWDEKYADYLAELDKKKPVLAAGDFNVAHTEIDLANPAGNHFSAGFTDEEREGFTRLLDRGFVDTFRQTHPGQGGNYSWWAQRVKTSKINNSGWRIDYWLVSTRIMKNVIGSEMVDSGPRQDHSPILLEIKI